MQWGSNLSRWSTCIMCFKCQEKLMRNSSEMSKLGTLLTHHLPLALCYTPLVKRIVQ